MSYLTLDADRLVRDAVDAFLSGRLRPDPLPDTVYATKNSRYRIIAGLVHEATDTSLMGAELVGWLMEEAGSARIEPRWRASARGVFVERKSGHAVVTSRVLTRSVVSESGRPRAGAGAGTIPPAPPIPQLKQAPSIAPPELVSLGAPDPKPVRPASRPSISEEEITKVERTEIADADELQALRQTSAHSIPPPSMNADRPLPSMPMPDDLDAPTRPVIAGSAEAVQQQADSSRPSQPPPRMTPRLVAPRMQSSRPPPPRPSSRRKTPAPSTARKPPPPTPSTKKGIAPAPKSSQKPLPPPNPPPRKSR